MDPSPGSAHLDSVVAAFPLPGRAFESGVIGVADPEEREPDRRLLRAIDRNVDERDVEPGVGGLRVLAGLPFVTRPTQPERRRSLDPQRVAAAHAAHLANRLPHLEVAAP